MALDAKKILVPVNGDNAGVEAFLLACGLSKGSKASLVALYVLEIKQELPLDAEVDASHGETVLNRIEAIGHEQKCLVEAKYLQARQAGPAVVEEATDRNADLIVLGIPYKRRYGSFALGRTTSHILKHAPCPVILWRQQARANAPVGS